MSSPADAWRRWFGLLFLFTALGMLIWGQTLLQPYLKGLWFVLYWLACMGLTFLAFCTALLDYWIVRHRGREEQRSLLKKTLHEIGADDVTDDVTSTHQPKRSDPGERS